jgi:hypothetical protein
MSSITLEYDYSDIQTQKTLNYILSLGLFKPTIKDHTGDNNILEKREQNELKNYMVDLSNYKFNTEGTNQHKEVSIESMEGCLKEYANPALWEKEKHAWEDNILEKYGNI